MPSIQVTNETEDDEMNQDTPDSDRSLDHESESESGTENEESSGKSPYYRLQSELDLKHGEGR